MLAFDAISFIDQVAQNIKDLNAREDEQYWRKAKKKEINCLEKNNAWEEKGISENGEILLGICIQTVRTRNK